MEADARFAFYMGAYGPTMIVITDSTEWLHHLKDMLDQLRQGSIREIEFTHFNNIEVTGFSRFTLTKTQKQKDSYISAINEDRHCVIHWVQTESELEDMISLIDALLEAGQGHQYFGEEGEVLVELSLNERRI